MLLCLAIGIVYCNKSYAQNTDSKINLDIVEFVNPERMINEIRDFASPAFEGREIGTIGNRKATNWISFKFDEIGLNYFPRFSKYEFPFYVYSFDQGKYNSITTIREQFQGRDISPAIWGTNTEVTAEMTSSLDSTFTGKIILHQLESGIEFNPESFDRVFHHSINLQSLGAIGIIYYWPIDFSDGVNLYRFEDFVEIPLLAQKNITNSSKPFIYLRELPIPILFANHSTGEKLAAHIPEPARIKADFSAIKEEEVYNNIAYLPGVNERLDRAVVVVANLDQEGSNSVNGTPYLGANNNASGIISMLEIARAIKALGQKPKYSIIFLALNGSRRNRSGLQAMIDTQELNSLKLCTWLELQSIAYSLTEDEDTHAKVYVESRDLDFKKLVERSSRRPKLDVSLYADFVPLDAFYTNYIKITADESPYTNRVVDAQNKLNFVTMYRVTQLAADIVWRIANDEQN